MQRTYHRTGVTIFIAVTLALALLLTGYMRGDLRSHTHTQAGLAEPTVAYSDDLPEVVVTASRTQQQTIAMSARDASRGSASH
jgi:hypothetical protein